METVMPEACRRKAKELGLDILVVEEAARVHGWTVEDTLRRIELRSEFWEATGEANEETEHAAAAAAAHERERARERGRDRSGRVRIAGYKLVTIETSEGQRRMLRETAETLTRGLREPTADEERMVADLEVWLGTWRVRLRHGLGVTDGGVSKLRRVHALVQELHDWGTDARIEHMLRTMCRLALMFRLAGGRPPKGTPGTGDDIVAAVRADATAAGIAEPTWLTTPDLGAQLEAALSHSTLTRGATGRKNIDSEIDRILAASQ